MQVSHSHDHVTHAVVGGGVAINFGISDSPEFFQILSSTLYTNQILAVVRETLCNAWDAHIMRGCTDVPIQVTLTDDELVIQDFGPGIPHKLIGPIYGVYGASTKKNDGKQTGGFGLGCKAPFAYTDHFEVINVYGSTKTIYRMSKSSAMVGGKPSITPIVSVPAKPDEQSGVLVKIPLKPGDRHMFRSYLQEVIYAGQIKALINQQPAAMLDFDSSKHSWLVLTPGNSFPKMNSRILVRYGNVVYPVQTTPELRDSYNEIQGILDKLAGRYDPQWSILFQAPPHSISVTPSREALSMQEHTIKTLQGLFQDFLEATNRDLIEKCLAAVKRRADALAEKGKVHVLLDRTAKVPDSADKTTIPLTFSDLDALTEQYIRHNYPSGFRFRQWDITHRVLSLTQKSLLNRGLVQSFLKELNKPGQENHSRTQWLGRRILAPLVQRMSQDAKMDPAKLYVLDSKDWNREEYGVGEDRHLVPYKHACPRNIIAYLPYLRNTVILSRVRRDFLELLPSELTGFTDGHLFYHVGRKAGEAEAAREFFQSRGLAIIDLVAKADALNQKRKASAPPTMVKKTPRRQGLLAASFLLNSEGCINTTRFDASCFNEEREAHTWLTEPKAILTASTLRRDNGYIGDWGYSLSGLLIQKFGDQVGIATNETQAKAWRAKHSLPSFDEFVVAETLKHISNNPRILAYKTTCKESLLGTLGYRERSLAEILYLVPKYRKKFGIKYELGEEEKDFVAIWDFIQDHYAFQSDEVKALSAKFKKVLTNQYHTKLKECINNTTKSPLCSVISFSNAVDLLRADPEFKSGETKALIKILDSVFVF